MGQILFHDRKEAGKALAPAVLAALKKLPEPSDPVVLALPRGGVPVGREVAQACKAPMDLLMVRKLGLPHQPELAAGAVVNGADPQMVVNPDVLRMAGMTPDDLIPLRDRELAEIARRRTLYLSGRPPVAVRGRDVVVVDDGIATGATMRAALRGLERMRPRHVLLAVPVAPRDTLEALRSQVDSVICLHIPSPFRAVGSHYRIFDQVDDAEVTRCLQEARRD